MTETKSVKKVKMIPAEHKAILSTRVAGLIKNGVIIPPVNQATLNLLKKSERALSWLEFKLMNSQRVGLYTLYYSSFVKI